MGGCTTNRRSLDIDADGILNVSAKDKGTGKEQNIVIRSSGGLSDEDIESMVRDAEAHGEIDLKRRKLVDARNDIESLVYNTQKSINEHGEKLDSQIKAQAEKAIEEAIKVKDSDDLDDIKMDSKNTVDAEYEEKKSDKTN